LRAKPLRQEAFWVIRWRLTTGISALLRRYICAPGFWIENWRKCNDFRAYYIEEDSTWNNSCKKEFQLRVQSNHADTFNKRLKYFLPKSRKTVNLE
jgi:hypothetical protein